MPRTEPKVERKKGSFGANFTASLNWYSAVGRSPARVAWMPFSACNWASEEDFWAKSARCTDEEQVSAQRRQKARVSHFWEGVWTTVPAGAVLEQRPSKPAR